MTRLLTLGLILAGSISVSSAADWPMYRGDAERSGFTADSLAEQLSLNWTLRPAHPPQPAWPRDDRMLFDRAHDVVVAGGVLVYGSAVEGTVVALDAKTGEEKWTYFTDAPVRFAPAIWKDQVFAVSDDGYLYCLALADGRLLRRWRGGPTDQMILGNGRMVSRWPARGGPVIRDGIVYFGAGIWQSDGIYLIAIDAESGREIWRNDQAGKIYMPQPHGGANAESGVSAQGYLVATENDLLVPTGRAVPALFSRGNGEFRYYHLQANGHTGGTQTVAIGESFYNGGTAFQLSDGALETKLGAGSVARFADGILHGGQREIRALKVVSKSVPDRKGMPVQTRIHEKDWTIAGPDGSISLVVAGETIVVGGDRKVALIDSKSRQVTATFDVDGLPYGLAVADQRLYVSTDQGTIYCFGPATNQEPRELATKPTKIVLDARYVQAADEIVRRSGVTEGYCLDLDAGDCSLAVALARRTNLQIYALCVSAEDVAKSRQRLSEAGLYGARITVHLADVVSGRLSPRPRTGAVPNGATDASSAGSTHDSDGRGDRYGKYFADLTVSARSLADGPLAISTASPPATLRPGGGKACSGRVGEMQLVERPPLPKTGNWTHQYANLGNTSCSEDEVVQGELKALWFRDVDLEMPQRHGRGHAPLFYEGRMFVEGLDALRAVDAYNGRSLWEFALPGIQAAFNADHLVGTAVTGSNLCVASSGVYVHDKQRCYRLDPATGKKLGEFAPPVRPDGKPGQWGFIACDGARLYGTLANPQHQVRYAYLRADMSDMWGESATFFALDAATGKLLWRYDAEHSIRNNAIAVGPAQVYLIDRAIADEDQWDPKDASRKLPAVKEINHAPGSLIALDAQTGRQLWKRDRAAFGTMLVYSAAHDALLMGYQSTRFKLPSEVGGKLAVFRGQDGRTLWEREAKYVTRPLINDRIVYAQGGAWNLLTGEERPFELNRSYGCGQLAASRHMLLFRSATLGYLDLNRGSGVENFGGIRPGCWINALPVGGLVLVPDASAGCRCSYQNRSWMALAGDD